MRLALHPNDPPVPEVCGVPSLIWNTECYKKAFELAGNSPYLGMKMCVGCWLESENFGNLMEDIRTFTEQGKIFVVHFRNVSGTMPYFEETLLEDGYADMYAIMKAIYDTCPDTYVRPDHGRMIWDEQGRPGYGLYDRALGSAYINGLIETNGGVIEK